MFIVVFALAVVGLDVAAQTTHCHDLMKMSCIPTTRSDGTGTSLSPAEREERILEIEAKHRARIRKSSAELLHKEGNEHIRNMVQASLNLTPDECEAMGSDQCKRAIDDRFYEIVRRDVFGRYDRWAVPEGSIADVTALRGNEVYRSYVEGVRKAFSADRDDKALIRRIERHIFPRVRREFVKRLEELPIEDKLKRRMMAKIDNISYEFGCSDNNTYEHEPNAFYTWDKNRIMLCEGFLQGTTSEFAIVSVLAHEIGHAIDPCNLGHPSHGTFSYVSGPNAPPFDQQYPIPGLIQCLRQDNSMQAKDHRQAFLDEMKTWKSKGADYFKDLKINQRGQYVIPGMPDTFAMTREAFERLANEVERKGGPMALCNRCDQIGEATSDWWSGEITPRYMETYNKLTREQYVNGYANQMVIFCPSTVDAKHPVNERRINALLSVHPKVREHMGCTSNHPRYQYCQVGATTSSTPASSTPTSSEATQ